MPWTFYNANGQRLSSAATNISVLDIDGATDIGAAIVDADLFIIDDGAGGTNRKTAASRIKTYVEDAAGEVPIANLDIDGGTDIGADIVDADLFIIDDGAGGTNRKTAASRLKTYIGSVSQASSGAIVAQTNEDTYVPPDLVKNSPGVAKAWCQVSSGGGVGSGDHGVASIAKGATGKYVITFDTAFSSAVYAVSVTVESGDANFGTKTTAAADTAAIDIWTHAGAAVDAAFYFTAFGTLS